MCKQSHGRVMNRTKCPFTMNFKENLSDSTLQLHWYCASHNHTMFMPLPEITLDVDKQEIYPFMVFTFKGKKKRQ